MIMLYSLILYINIWINPLTKITDQSLSEESIYSLFLKKASSTLGF